MNQEERDMALADVVANLEGGLNMVRRALSDVEGLLDNTRKQTRKSTGDAVEMVVNVSVSTPLLLVEHRSHGTNAERIFNVPVSTPRTVTRKVVNADEHRCHETCQHLVTTLGRTSYGCVLREGNTQWLGHDDKGIIPSLYCEEAVAAKEAEDERPF